MARESTILRLPTGGLLRQGSRDDALNATRGGYDLVVLCAIEWQPPTSLFRNVRTDVLHAPQNDATIGKHQVMVASQAALEVARAIKNGKRVLVTCNQGRNRSGLVSALAVRMLCATDGRTARRLVQSRRENALTNETFKKFLDGLPEPKKGR